MSFEFYDHLKASYNYQEPAQAGYAVRELGIYIASGNASQKECFEAIDSLALASISYSSNLRWFAADGFQEVFLSNKIDGAELIDLALQNSEVYSHFGKDQKDLFGSTLQDATNQYIGNRRETPNPKLDEYSGQVFMVNFSNQDTSRKLTLKM